MKNPIPLLLALAESATGGIGGAVVGCNLRGCRHIIVYNCPNYEPVSRRSTFEIASVTKVITGILLATMAEHEEVRLNESVASVIGIFDLPEIWSSITLLDLAMHRSGLPRLPPNLNGSFWNPYRGWGRHELYDAMRQSSPRKIMDGRSNYSNFGIAVLAEALSSRAGIPYDELVKLRICQPLDLQDLMATSLQRAGQQAIGYTFLGQRAEPWDFEAMIGAGGLSSTVEDLLLLAEGILDLRPTPLTVALRSSIHSTKSVVGDSGFRLCWYVTKLNQTSIAWASGGVAGFASYIGIHLNSKVALVALLNSGQPNSLVKASFITLSKLCLI